MSSTRESTHSDFSQPECGQTADLLNTETISIHDGLRALLHQCLQTNEDYAALDKAVIKLEDAVQKWEDREVRCTEIANQQMTGRGSTGRLAAASFNFDVCQHQPANNKLYDARAQRDAMLKRVYNEEVLPVVIEAANADSIRERLETLGAALAERPSQEDTLYEPYVELCHAALDFFQDAPRSKLPGYDTALDIRFMANPKDCLVEIPLRQAPHGRIKRKPDILCTSRLAHQVFSSDSQRKKMAWPHVLQCVEVRTGSTRTPQVPTRSENFKLSDYKMGDSQSANDGRKRKHEGATKTGGQSSSKRSRTSSNFNPSSSRPSSTPQDITTSDAEAQTGAYGLAMLSHSQGVKHIINFLVSGNTGPNSGIGPSINIIIINRQSIFTTDPLDIFKDFPSFLAVLFILQRFTITNWGIVPTLNPAAVAALNGQTTLSEDFTFNFRSDCLYPWFDKRTPAIVIRPDYISHQPRTLLGRATGVRRAHLETDAEEKLACKIYNPEVARHHEGKTLVALHAIAEKFDPTMRRHLPTLRAYADIPDTDTRWLASVLGRPIKGHRRTRMIVLEALSPIQDTLNGDTDGRTFIRAWLDVVKCHAFLWKHQVEHGDPSLGNTMYDPRLKCGVLIDFDLSVFRWGPRVPGTDRTGTIPFMAIRLLCEEYWAGKIVRRYFDELEALCWILPFVWLGGTKPGSPIDLWKTHDHNVCRQQKSDFLQQPNKWINKYEPKATKRFVQYIVYGVIKVANTKLQAFEDEQLFRTLSEAPDKGEEDASTPDPGSFPGHDKEVLELLLGVLGKHTAGLVPTDYVANFPKPTFTKPTAEEANRIIGIVGTDLFV